MDNGKNHDLYTAIETAALRAYGELLAPDLAKNAAAAFASDTADMVERLLDEGVGALREQIQGQLAALPGAGKDKDGAAKKDKKVVKRPIKKGDDEQPAAMA
jgi:hypothetical protein